MKPLLILFVVLTIVISIVSPEKEFICGPTEEFSPCLAKCQKTCATRMQDLNCIRTICVPGCICKLGQLRNDMGVCVNETDCTDPSCGHPGMIYKPRGDRCPLNCISVHGFRWFCNQPYWDHGACACKNGYVRDYHGNCILVKDCPPIPKRGVCPGDPNAYSTTCGDPCPATCQNMNMKGPKICAEVCSKDRCKCKKGYVLDWNRQFCIKPSDCPKCSGPNERYTCTSERDTQCDMLGEIGKYIYHPDCENRCVCEQGFARNSSGICIPSEECPPKKCIHDPNAIALACGDPCPRTCANRDNKGPRKCPGICIDNGCKCNEGFVVGSDGLCIRESLCDIKESSDKFLEYY